jgi:hypothetical protein
VQAGIGVPCSARQGNTCGYLTNRPEQAGEFDRCEGRFNKRVTRRVSCSSVKDDMENNARRFGKNSISSTWMVGAACHEKKFKPHQGLSLRREMYQARNSKDGRRRRSVLGVTPDDHWLARDSRLMILRFYSAIFVPSTFLFQRAVKMRPPLAMFGALRRALPAFNAAEAFACRKSVHNKAQSGYKSARQTPFLSAFRARAAPARQQSTTAPSSSPLSELSKTIGQSSASAKNTIGQQSSARAKKSYFPETTHKTVGYWLLASSASVFGIVIFGGLTRLTESGFVANSVPALQTLK